MNSRTRINNILSKNANGNQGLWIGNPDDATVDIYAKSLNVKGKEGIYEYFKDDCRWVFPDNDYADPDGRPAFGFIDGKPVDPMECHMLAEAETIADVEKYNWPKVEYMDFTKTLEIIKSHEDKGVFSGMWSPFFHVVSDIMGMEEYFCKMYTNPEVIEAITEKVVDYYVAANEKLFAQAGDSFDTFFFGNDFGTQREMFISEDCFKQFILPSFKRLINVGKKYNKKIIIHSCGAIDKVIPMLIDAGIDGLHPLQALAANMDAKHLAKEYGKDIAFMGGVDTQELMTVGTPTQVKDEVLRLRDVFGGNYIVSPSHECILPNVPLENVVALVEAARE